MDFLASEKGEKINDSEVSVDKKDAMIGDSEENKDKHQDCCPNIPGKVGSASWMKLMADSNPATQLALSSCSGEENFKSKNLLRQQSGFYTALPALLRAAGSAVPEKQSGVTAHCAQLTIFYDGTVNVYDDISADKAQAIMLLASNGNNGSLGTRSPPDKSISLAIYNQPTRKISDLPIARKHSLQRFLEKRQDRRQAKGPHAREETVKQSPNPTSSSPSLLSN